MWWWCGKVDGGSARLIVSVRRYRWWCGSFGMIVVQELPGWLAVVIWRCSFRNWCCGIVGGIAVILGWLMV
jgi:hypothetical protein